MRAKNNMPSKRAGADAGWPLLFAFEDPRSGTAQKP